MEKDTAYRNDLKRKIRNLKKLEQKIRYGFHSETQKAGFHSPNTEKYSLIWNEFFSLNDTNHRNVRYSFEVLLGMEKEELKQIINEFMYHVYYRLYQEKGISLEEVNEPDFISFLGLSPDADQSIIKKRFHELVKKYHPDAGGDKEKFIQLMEWMKRN